MSEVFLGQVMIGGFNFPPRDFAACAGQVVTIAQNTALFSLLGTQFGGNGTTTFALPDLRARTPIGFSVSPSIPVGRSGGAETVTLLGSNLPVHNHLVNASTAPGVNRVPAGGVHATGVHAGSPVDLYGPATLGDPVLGAQSVALAGGGQAHTNLQPYCVVNFCIALYGLYPLRP